MSALVPILIATAARVGAPIVKDLLEKHVGGQVADVGGSIIDVIAGQAGVKPEQLPNLPPTDLEAAVAATEPVAAALAAELERMREANRLQLAEMEHGPTWSWAWRPGWMWLLAAFWTWFIVVVPIVNLIAGAAVVLPVGVGDLFQLTAVYLGLYMGGHTFKTFVKR